jgi:hypothetical protein
MNALSAPIAMATMGARVRTPAKTAAPPTVIFVFAVT